MTILAGYGGSVKIEEHAVAELDNWSVDIKRKLGDSSAFGDEWDRRSPLTVGWTAKAAGRLNEADADGQVVLQTHILGNPVSLTLDLLVDATHKFFGEAFLSGMTVNTVRDGFIEVDFTFEGNGALAYHPTI